ncbi:TPA: replication/maintenance protein RepL [Staphylococcus aureus]|nr:replication/maintenance protein RepL [Staphylococcus aureus]
MAKERYGTVYKGKETYVNQETGEVLEVDKIYRQQVQGNFVKAYIKGLVMMLDVVGGSKLKVVNYLLDNLRLSDNKLIATTREIADNTKTSPTTVTDTLKTLEKGNVIKRRTGVIMLNPEILLRGDDNKHRHLLVEFREFDRANEEQHAKVEYESFKDNSDTL